jgi:hypothetical protein
MKLLNTDEIIIIIIIITIIIIICRMQNAHARNATSVSMEILQWSIKFDFNIHRRNSASVADI